MIMDDTCIQNIKVKIIKIDLNYKEKSIPIFDNVMKSKTNSDNK